MLLKPSKYIICCALISLFTALYISFIKKENSQESKIAAALGLVKENEVWKSHYEPFMTIPFSKCWEMIADMGFRSDQEPTEILSVQPAKLCNETSKNKWIIMYEGGLQRNPHALPPAPKERPFAKELNLDGRKVYFYGDNQGNWIANFKCGSVYFDIEKHRFSYHLQEQSTENKDHEVPDVFKEFISSIKCGS